MEYSFGVRYNMLTESERRVKRYYIRPQNVFCSNKEDILKNLAKFSNENCSVYSLKSLEDHDDVHLLMPKDIIYYYDDGILYDKNHVKVMDYDLFVKNEEERRKFADVDKVTDAEFDKVYDDRLTESYSHMTIPEFKAEVESGADVDVGYTWEDLDDVYLVGDEPYGGTIYFVTKHEDGGYVVTKQVIGHHGTEGDETKIPFASIEEVLEFLKSVNFDDCYIDFTDDIYTEAFEQEYDDINAYGDNLAMNQKICCICGEPFEGYGNNPAPVKQDGLCCDTCNRHFVIPARIQLYMQNKKFDD